jgi:hypothetical protein
LSPHRRCGLTIFALALSFIGASAFSFARVNTDPNI